MEKRYIKLNNKAGKFYSLIKADGKWQTVNPVDSVQGEWKECFLKRDDAGRYGIKDSFNIVFDNGNGNETIVEMSLAGATPGIIAALIDEDLSFGDVYIKVWETEPNDQGNTFINGGVWVDRNKLDWGVDAEEVRKLRDWEFLTSVSDRLPNFTGVKDYSKKDRNHSAAEEKATKAKPKADKKDKMPRAEITSPDELPGMDDLPF